MDGYYSTCSAQDLLILYKNKLEEIAQLVTYFPAEKREEAWLFWEVISNTIRPILQVLKDNNEKSASKKSKTKSSRSSKKSKSKPESKKNTEKKGKSKEKSGIKTNKVSDTIVKLDTDVNQQSNSNVHTEVLIDSANIEESVMKTFGFSDLLLYATSDQSGTAEVKPVIVLQQDNVPTILTTTDPNGEIKITEEQQEIGVFRDDFDDDNGDDNYYPKEASHQVSQGDTTESQQKKKKKSQKENKKPHVLDSNKVKTEPDSHEATEQEPGSSSNSVSASKPKRRRRKVKSSDYLYENHNYSKPPEKCENLSKDDREVIVIGPLVPGLSEDDKSFRRKRRTKEEIQQAVYACEQCNCVLSSLSALDVHMRVHTGHRPFKCNQCGKRFQTKGNLQRHERSHRGERPYSCTTCFKAFTEKKSLKVHMRIHTGEKPFKCQECGKAFNQSGPLIAHTAMHKGLKPHLCELCGKAFRNRSGLRIHYERHSDQKRYFCMSCESSFFTKGELINHQKIHTGRKEFLCSECPKVFSRIEALQHHIAYHNGERVHKCTKCPGKFSDKNALDRHRKVHKLVKDKSSQISSKNLSLNKTVVELENLIRAAKSIDEGMQNTPNNSTSTENSELTEKTDKDTQVKIVVSKESNCDQELTAVNQDLAASSTPATEHYYIVEGDDESVMATINLLANQMTVENK